MFEPYINLACLLSKKLIVVSDNDRLLSDKQEKSSRFKKLEEICNEKHIKLIEMVKEYYYILLILVKIKR